MSVALLNTAFPLDPSNPLNQHHRLNQGRTLWLLAQPALAAGKWWWNLVAGGPSTVTPLVNFAQAGSGWTGDARPGGGQSVKHVAGTGELVNTNLVISKAGSASEITLAVWFRWLDATTTQTTAHALPHLFDDGASNFIGFHVGTVTGLGDHVWAYNWDGNEDRVGGPYTRNVWARALMTHTGGNLTLYVNGTSAGTVASGNTSTVSGSLVTGQSGVTCPNFQVDDLCAWSRGLSASEALEDYLESLAGYPNVLNRVSPLGILDLIKPVGSPLLRRRRLVAS